MYNSNEEHQLMTETSPRQQQKPRARQRPACEECRRRKLRCDGKKPRCSTCEHANTECDINTNRVPRGPKKGYLTALQSKIATLESRLQAQEQGHSFRWPDGGSFDDTEEMLALTANIAPSEILKSGSESHIINMPSMPLEAETESLFNTFFDVDSVSSTAMSLISDPTSGSSPNSTDSTPSNMHITTMMQEELDQLYFDRMHATVPILHQRKYLSWSKASVKSKSRICLQYAVWLTASLMSNQFQHLQSTIYPELKRSLASIKLPPSSGGNFLEIDIELIQAWILTATYQFVKTDHHEACISTARAFRLVQLMGLHEIDHPSNNRAASSPNVSGPDIIAVEEKRRAFWMAFTLEALYSMRNNLPLVVNEHMISTNLPVPDHDFQSGQQVQTGLLGDLISKRSQDIKSPLNECIMLVAMCARTTFHAQQYIKQQNCLYSHADCDRLEWQQWLDNVLLLRLQTLAQDYPSPTNSPDPTLLFANFFAQASIVYLWRETRSMDWSGTGCSGSAANGGAGGGAGRLGGHLAFVAEYQQSAFAAVRRTVELAHSLVDFPLFKIHPFMTIPLGLAVDFLSQNQSDQTASQLLRNLLDTLRKLKNVNNSQQSYIDLLHLNQLIESIHV